MKLSHKSKVRLSVGALSFVALVAAIVALSIPPLNPFSSSSFKRFLNDHAVEFSDESPESRGFSSKFTKLSSASFDAASVQSLDFDVSSGTVETKIIDGDKVTVTESAHIKKGFKPARAANRDLATVENGVLKIAKFDYNDDRAIVRVVTVGIPRELAGKLARVDLNVLSGDVTINDVTCDELSLKASSGDIEFDGGVNDTLDAEVGSGDVDIELNRAPATSMNVHEGSGDIDISLPRNTGFTAQLTMGSGDFESDFLSSDVDGSDISNLTFDNGDKSAAYRIEIDSGDMTLGAH